MSSKDCPNDCVEPLLFPKRPNNRAGLSRIDYRIGTYADIREALLRWLDNDPVLAAWTYREADDPGIALLEGAAILGDILTFYQNLYANEGYLRTAQWRDSIADLVKLLGYRLSPGLGGKGIFAIGVKKTQPVLVPAGFSVKAQLTGLAQQAEFETRTEFVAIPALSEFHLYRPTRTPPFGETVTVFSIATVQLEQAGVQINASDRLMLLDREPTNNAQIVVVKAVEPDFDRTRIAIEGTWKKGSGLHQVKAFKLGRTFRHFGHNAPPYVVKLTDATATQQAITYNRKLHSTTGITGDTTIEPSLAAKVLPLDNEVNDLVVGSNLILEGVAYHNATLVRQIDSFQAASMTWGALSGATTLVTVTEEIDDLRFGHTHSYTDIRNLVIHETIGSSFQLTSNPQPDPAADGERLEFFGEPDVYKQLDGRTLILRKADGTVIEVVGAITRTGLIGSRAKFRPLFLSPPLSAPFSLTDFPRSQPQVTVYGNAIEAFQGKTEKEAVLGNGDQRQIFQTFKLPKSPLTYFNSSSETPPEIPELQVYVNNHLWKQVSSLFGQKPDAEIYIVRQDANGDSWAQFGDGETGARLPSGIKNVVAKYRTGIGAYGTLKEGTKVQGGKLDRLDQLWLPGIVAGGAQPETGENAREAAPGKVQSLGRLVSLKDFETETLAISGVSKVSATWTLVLNVPAVVLTVLMETGREKEIEEVRIILKTYNRCRGLNRFPIRVELGQRQYIYLNVTVALEPTVRQELVEQAIKVALGVTGEEGNSVDGSRGLLGLYSRQFGQPEYATRIAGTVQNVPGVRWARVMAAGLMLGTEDDPLKLSFPPNPKPLHQKIACGNQQILSLHRVHLNLNFATLATQEVC